MFTFKEFRTYWSQGQEITAFKFDLGCELYLLHPSHDCGTQSSARGTPRTSPRPLVKTEIQKSLLDHQLTCK